MKLKIVPAELVEDICSSCPHCHYDSYYSMGTDSGYDCWHPDAENRRIADDWQLTQYHDKLKEAKRLPLLPENVDDPHPMSIPDWCPLEDWKHED